MEISLKLNIGSSPDPVALQQFMHWALVLDNAAEEDPIPDMSFQPMPVKQPEAPLFDPAKTNGAASPVAPSRRGRGRPRAADAAAAAASLGAPPAAAETSAPGVVPGAALPPGVALPSVLQPAMPQPMTAPVGTNGANGGNMLDELRACCAEATKREAGLSFRMLKATTWSDGSPKPQWFTVEGVPVELRERLIMEMMTALNS